MPDITLMCAYTWDESDLALTSGSLSVVGEGSARSVKKRYRTRRECPAEGQRPNLEGRDSWFPEELTLMLRPEGRVL